MRKNVLTSAKKKKALVLLGNNQLCEAQELLIKICELDKLDIDARLMLGIVYGKLGTHQLAVDCFSHVTSHQPLHAKAYFNLGIALRALLRFEDAVTAFRKAIQLDSTIPDTHVCLAHALISARKYDEAIEFYRAILKDDPRNAEMCSNLGMAYQALGRLDEAVESYRQAQSINPYIAYENLGGALTAQGKFDEAIACFREGVARKPEDYRTRSNLLLTLNYIPNLEADGVFRDHLEWGKVCSRGNLKRLSNVPDKGRKLRVGYVSPDFREHSVSYFFQPLLAGHNHGEFEIYCYSNLLAEHHDAVTSKIQSQVTGWRDIHSLDSEQVADWVRTDNIDILIDLSGHTSNHRLAVFALKPAPIQVTYLGYPNTSGMDTMDYRLTDSIADPDGVDKYYAEKLIRLPGCFLCYQPPLPSPDISTLPAASRKFVTFGSFNNMAKINEEVLAVWAELLGKIPESRLFLKNSSLSDQRTRDRLWGFFEERGVLANRVEMQGITSSTYEHLELYGKVDIALDTFPYNGTTTTCEALWMGVPVITLLGDAHASRVGGSLLTNLGMAEMVASSRERYIQLAVELAGDRLRLEKTRASLRGMVLGSALTDKLAFAIKIEEAYREAWHHWCESMVSRGAL